MFDTKDEKEYEEEERENKILDEMRKKGGKKVKKYLKSLEKNNTYESDSDGNPYFSEVRLKYVVRWNSADLS